MESFTGWLVVGLGNPDEEYAKTRHNVGFEVVDFLARLWRARDWSNRWASFRGDNSRNFF